MRNHSIKSIFCTIARYCEHSRILKTKISCASEIYLHYRRSQCIKTMLFRNSYRGKEDYALCILLGCVFHKQQAKVTFPYFLLTIIILFLTRTRVFRKVFVHIYGKPYANDVWFFEEKSKNIVWAYELCFILDLNEKMRKSYV